jgi:enamine deaminase RidA (YjgF/YER057c/UK114 family)
MAHITVMQPDGLQKPPMYSQVAIAQGERVIYISGQVPTDPAGRIVGGNDLRAQLVQVYENLSIALAAAGATFDNVVKQTTYVVDYKPEHRAIIADVRLRYVNRDRLPASTLVGVQALAFPEFLIEVEVVAVV